MSETKQRDVIPKIEAQIKIATFANFSLLPEPTLPRYETVGSAGMDLRAAIAREELLRPMEVKMVPTGIGLELPFNMEAQVRPRSGLASKYGITLINSPGTIDSDYRGEIFVPLINLSREDFTLLPGMRIAQMIVAPYVKVYWDHVSDLAQTQRGDSGFGSTGHK